ncbi:hypothetical protein B0H19DRAFT_1055693 [Mycena capillaripes]|nr:hypothetical protein B0H19DRAFT_1055693 [Mycena capillaripes]
MASQYPVLESYLMSILRASERAAVVGIHGLQIFSLASCWVGAGSSQLRIPPTYLKDAAPHFIHARHSLRHSNTLFHAQTSTSMPLSALLFSSYRAEVSVDIQLQLYKIPGIGIPAKVLVAQITDNLVVLMVGFLGHELPLLSFADWSGVGFTMDSPSRSVNLHFADIRPMGTLAHFTGGGDDCSLVVRIVLETQAAFWGLAYRLAQPLADPVAIATAIWANQPIIQMLLDSFRADDGSEHFGGARVDEAPPGYTGRKMFWAFGPIGRDDASCRSPLGSSPMLSPGPQESTLSQTSILWRRAAVYWFCPGRASPHSHARQVVPFAKCALQVAAFVKCLVQNMYAFANSWPFRLHARIEMTSETLPSLFTALDDTVIHVSGAGLSFVSLHIEDSLGNVFDVLDVDTLRADVSEDPPTWAFTGSWAYRPEMDRHRIRIELFFADREYLGGFLLALSYVRLSKGRSPVKLFSLHEIPPGNTHFNKSHANAFLTMRNTVYEDAPIHSIPVEVLSEIFAFVHPSRNQTDHLGSPFLLMRVCWTWAAVAIGTAELWRHRAIVLGRPFLRCRDDSYRSQLSLWLKRGNSENVTLSMYFMHSRYLPNEIFDSTHFDASSFDAVQTLNLSGPASQLSSFVGPDAPSLPSLATLSLTTQWTKWPNSAQLCLSTPLLRSLTINSMWKKPRNRHYSLVLAFPWSQLTTIRIRIHLPISSWMPIFSQCLLLQTGKFLLWGGRYVHPPQRVTFHDLVSLCISFRDACNTQFFAHVTLPAIRELHIGGVLDDRDAVTPFIPRFPTLRVLILDIELPLNALQQIVGAHPDLEQLSVFTQADGTLSTGIWELPGLRMLTISTSIDTVELIRLFSENITARAIRALSAGCNMRFCGGTEVHNELLAAFAKESTVVAFLEANPPVDPFDDHLQSMFPFRRFCSLSVQSVDHRVMVSASAR